uniref:hypothetical protein n=1 Tax=Streptomyces ipomoeae TaxID=103232 RepID=UPI002852F0EB|nr:hypothetical protein [Streptomyces ipomoeae]
MLDLVSTWLCQALEAEATLPQKARRRAMSERIRAFIRQNLRDPELTPPLIAIAHHISVSYLHRTFEQQPPGETGAAWFCGQRLGNARRDLEDLRRVPRRSIPSPPAGDSPVPPISRAFRAAYGLSPKEHRMQARSARQ